MLQYQIWRWWAFRNVKHPDLGWIVWWLPLAVAAGATLVLILTPEHAVLSGVDGLLNKVASVLAFLPGFFIAALAAVATFERRGLDLEMPAPSPTLLFKDGRSEEALPLTYRMYVSYLFGHIAVLSIAMIIISFVSNYFIEAISIAPKIESAIMDIDFYINVRHIIKYMFIFIYFYFIASILLIALHGIYFLMERLHQVGE